MVEDRRPYSDPPTTTTTTITTTAAMHYHLLCPDLATSSCSSSAGHQCPLFVPAAKTLFIFAQLAARHLACQPIPLRGAS